MLGVAVLRYCANSASHDDACRNWPSSLSAKARDMTNMKTAYWKVRCGEEAVATRRICNACSIGLKYLHLALTIVLPLSHGSDPGSTQILWVQVTILLSGKFSRGRLTG